MNTTERLALATLVLRREPYTTGVAHALLLIDGAMPPGGTPERRAAFAFAHNLRPDLREEAPDNA